MIQRTALPSAARVSVLALGASALLALAISAPAQAQDLTTDGSDPNGAPPPPPPMPSSGQPGSPTAPPPPGSTAAHLQKSTEEDTGVGLHFVYIQPEIGVGFASLGGALPDVAKDYRSGVGASIGLGAGLEFIAFQLGGRLRYLPTSHFDLWSAGGEIAYQPGSGRFWPRIGLGVGWAWTKGFDQKMCGTFCGAVEAKGLDVGLRGGFQYYVSSHVEIGADVTLDALFLTRPATLAGDAAYQKEGSGTGFSAALLAHAGFHYP